VCLNEDRIKNPVGGEPEARDPREWKGAGGCVVLLGGSHYGRPEAGDTLMMIYYGVGISIAGCGADEKDDMGMSNSFFFISYIHC